MNLYIQIKNGQPFEHPIMGDNLIQAFPDIDLNNLPPEFARFERIAIPLLNVYEIFEGTTYEWDNGIVKDVHHIRPMTLEEKTEKQNMMKRGWQVNGFPSWVFNEETCFFDPPISYPQDGKLYQWDEPTLNWVEI